MNLRSRSLQSSSLLIISACLLLMLSFGYRAGFGLFVPPITEANGWSREVISLSLAIQNLVWGVIAVFAGGLADRFGNVRVIIAGVLLYRNSWKLGEAVARMVEAGQAPALDLLPHVSPLGWEHINLTGEYRWRSLG